MRAFSLMGLARSSTGNSNIQKSQAGSNSSQVFVTPSVWLPRQSQDTNSSGTTGKLMWEKRQAQVPTGRTQVQASKTDDSLPNSLYQSLEGVYSSSSDPVHVPSPDLRSAATVGAIKREFGAAGVRCQSGENLAHPSFGQSISFSNSLLGKDGNSSRESFQPFTTSNKSEQPSQAAVPDSVVPSLPISRSFLSNQYSSRQHQQVVGNQKGRLITLHSLC